MIWLFWGVFVLICTYLGSDSGPFSKNSMVLTSFRILLILVLSVMTGLGGEEMTDHFEYEMKYRELQSVSLAQLISINEGNFFKNENFNWEIGFLIYSKILSLIGLSKVGFFFLTSLITNTLIVNTLYRYKYQVFCMLLFISSHMYFQEANIVRQTFAISIFLYSLRFFDQGKPIKHYLFILLASLMHTAVLLCAFLYPIRYISTKKGQNFLGLLLLFLWLLSIYIALFSDFTNFNMLTMYTLGQYDSLWEKSEFEIGTRSMDTINNFLVLCVFADVILRKRSKEKIYFNMYMFGTILYVILNNISVKIFYFYRVSLIFEMFFCLYIGVILQQMTSFGKFSKNYTAPFVVILLFKIAMFGLFVINGGHGAVGNSFYSIFDIFI